MQRILDAEKDIVNDDVAFHLKWTDAEKTKFPYEHSRPLPQETAQKAIDYIAVITKRYPFQIRWAMARPLWERFAKEWCDTGDEQKALRVI